MPRDVRPGRDATYDQVANKDLKNLGLQASPASEQALEEVDKDMAQGGADEGAIHGHLGHARSEVVTMLAPILCDP